MQYTDSSKEDMYQTAKLDRINNLSQSVQENRSKTFNIVSHEGPARKYQSVLNAVTAKATISNRKYHMINNLNIEDHKTIPIVCNEDLIWSKIKNGTVPVVPVNKNRDFNVVSNKFYQDDDAKRLEEYNRTKEYVLQKYWDTHNYDPIKVKYYDAEKEKTYHKQHAILETVQGSSLAQKIPPSMLYSEGNSYNILNHSIYDDHKLKATRTVQDQALNRMKVLQVESRIKDERELKAEEAEKQKLNKVSFKRWENQIDRGYNMVTNIPDSISGAFTQPLPTRPTSMWTRLNSTSNNNNATGQSYGGGEGLGGLNGSLQASGRGATAAANSQRARNLSGYPSHRGESDYPNGLIPSPSFDSSNFNNNFNSIKTAPSNSTLEMAVSPLQSFRSAGSSSTSRSPPPTAAYQRPTTTFPRSNTVSSALQRSNSGVVPSLDLGRTEPPEQVSYVEPQGGANSAVIPIVRTGGLSAYKN